MIRRLLQDRSGSSAAEFAMVLPLLLVLLFGLIDTGRFLLT
jgi:Flp pilus assembly protein TadG